MQQWRRWLWFRMMWAGLFLFGSPMAYSGGPDPVKPPTDPKGASTLPKKKIGDPALLPIKQAIMERNYPKARKLLTDLLNAPKGRTIERMWVFAHLLKESKDYATAARIYLEVAEKIGPKKRTYARAILQRAEVLAEMRQYKPAQEIAVAQLQRLLSPERKLEMAAVSLRYAETHMKLAKNAEGEAQRQCWQKALALYRQALELELPDAKVREISLAIGKLHRKLGDHWSAASFLAVTYPKFKTGHLSDQIGFLYAESLLSQRDHIQSRRIAQDLLQDHPKSPLLPKIYLLLARSWGLPGYTPPKPLERGIEWYRQLLLHFPKDKLARRASWEIGQSYFSSYRLEEAKKAFEEFLQLWGNAPSSAKDEDRLIAQARHFLALSFLRQARYPEAIAAFQRFLQAHPTDAFWPDAQREIVNAEYNQAAALMQQKQWAGASQAFLAFLQRYPLDHRASVIMWSLAEMLHTQKQYADAVAAWEKLASKYPSSSEGQRAPYQIGLVYENDLLDYEKAIASYKKATSWSVRSLAQQALKRLTEKSLLVKTPRIFHSKEKAVLEASVRNLKALTVKLYRIHAETYFRKTGHLGGMENLDIQLIRPDRQWTLEIPKYRPHQLHKLEIALGETAPMVGVVQVSGEDLEATTIAVISDVLLISKVSRQAAFGLVLDSQTKKPVSGASILLSDGSKILWQGKTGPDGVAKVAHDGLKNSSQASLLALAGTSVASSQGFLSTLGHSEALQAAGLIYTDRPAYQPGEVIQIKGILREVKEGQYLIPDQPYTLTIQAPDGSILFRKILKPNEVGSIQTAYTSDPKSPVGRYLVQVTRSNGPHFQGSFLLSVTELPRYLLSLELPKRVFKRHEALKGTLRLLYSFGGPVANKELRYTLGTLQGTGKTDAKGEFALSLPTRELDTDQTYTLHAEMASEGVRTQATIWLRSTAFDLSLSTVRSVYAAGERFAVKIRALDPVGTGYPAKVTLDAFRKLQEQGRSHESFVSTQTIVLSAAGEGFASLQPKDGGAYILRARSVDASGHAVTTSHDLYISGSEDKTILRLLSDREEFKVGETASLKLLSRKPGIALLTYETQHVLSYQVIPALHVGEKALSIPLIDDFSPNVAVDVTLLHGTEIVNARKELLVARFLTVKLTPREAHLRPGEIAHVDIQTFDQSGKPTPAELSVAAVDAALFAIFPDTTPTLQSLFASHRRTLGTVTQSSSTWSYAAATKTIVEELREKDRKQEESEAQNIDTLKQGFRSGQGQIQRGYGSYDNGAYRNGMARRRYGRPSYLRSRRPYRPRPVQITESRIMIGGQAAPNANGQPPAEPMGGDAGGEGRAYLRDLRRVFVRTAFWQPSLRTDNQGKATIAIRMPDNTTTWKIIARGIARPTLVGQAETSVQVRKAFFAELALPSAVSEADRLSPQALFHNLTDEALQVQAILKIEGMGLQKLLSFALPAKGSQEIRFPEIGFQGSGDRKWRVQLDATAIGKGKPLTDRLARTLTVRRPELEVQTGSAGIARERESFRLKLPHALPYRHPSLELQIGPLSAQWVQEIAQVSSIYRIPAPLYAVTRGDLLLTSLTWLSGQKQADSEQGRTIKAQLTQAAQSLFLSQSTQGGWSFLSGSSDPHFSVRPFVLLHHASQTWGIFAPAGALDRAYRYLKEQFHQTLSDDLKAHLLVALSLRPGDDRDLFTYANRLFRRRASLSLPSLAFLGTTLLQLERPELAKQLQANLVNRLTTAMKETAPGVAWPWRRQPLPPRMDWASIALGLELLAKIDPRSSLLTEGIRKLLSIRRGLVWPSPVLTRRALRLLAGAYQNAQWGDIRLQVDVLVNGTSIGVRSFVGTSPTATLRVDLPSVAEGTTVELIPTGIGSFRYTALLKAFTSEVAREWRGRHHRVSRRIEPDLQKVDGKAIPRGFSILQESVKQWNNECKNLPVGQDATVHLLAHRTDSNVDRDDVIIEERLPAGVLLQPSSISLSSDRYIVEGQTIRFFLPKESYVLDVSYRITGRMPGHFRMPPTTLRSISRPDHFTVGDSRDLSVLPSEKVSPDPYRLTPDELYHIGKAHYDQNRYSKAEGYLRSLLKDFTLRSATLQEVARMLLEIALLEGPNASVVRYFELLKEQSPSTILSFDKIVRVGQAYVAQGEDERAYIVFRAILAATFLRELSVASTIEKEGDFKGSVRFVQGLLESYPDLRPVHEAFYALAQSVFQHADKETARPLVQQAWLHVADTLFHEFTWLYPESPSADAAGYGHANVLMGQRRYAEAASLLQGLALRHPKSAELDSIIYLEAYARYLQRQHTEAIELLQRVSTLRFPDDSGGLRESKNKYLAMYLIAQIYHAQDKLTEALAWYTKIRSRFVDAENQVSYLRQIKLHIPEITLIDPKTPARLEIKHQNTGEVTLLAYAVDLMKLYLIKKDLQSVTRINLAGIKPTWQATQVLGTTAEYQERTTHLLLPLTQTGSYLIVLKSAEREVSGILLRSNLSLEVQEDVASGRVTTHLFERTDRKPVAEAQVRVVGSVDRSLRSLSSDLRGISSTEGVQGHATIIAQRGDDFAFFRGRTLLGPPTTFSQPYNFQAPSSPAPMAAPKRSNLLDNVQERNKFIQRKARSKMLELYGNDNSGVQLNF